MKILPVIIASGLLGIVTISAQAENRATYTTSRSVDYIDATSEIFYVEGRVVSATPIYESTWYYRSRGEDRRTTLTENCRIREVEVYREGRNGGTAGAIIGGAIGAQVGSNAGRSPESTLVGALAGGVIGSVLGSEIDRNRGGTVQYRVEEYCDTTYRTEQRELIGYEVLYRYNGREFSMRTAQHPGRYVELRVEVQPTLR